MTRVECPDRGRSPLLDYEDAVDDPDAIPAGVARARMRSWSQKYKSVLSAKLSMRKVSAVLRRVEYLGQDDSSTAAYLVCAAVPASSYLARCISFYVRRCRIKVAEGDSVILASESRAPTGQHVDRLLAMYDQGFRSMETAHGLYRMRLASSRSVRTPGSRSRGAVPFNSFIRDQWATRGDELRAIAKEHGSASVMKLLGSEWTNRPRDEARPSPSAATGVPTRSGTTV